MSSAHKFLTVFIALVWLINGLFAKLLHLVPRHEQIIGGILGPEHAGILNNAIGILEILMSVWIVSGYQSRINAILQMVIIAAMNTLEILLVPDLLLFGPANGIFASMLVAAIYINEFYLNKNRRGGLFRNHPFAVEAFFKTSLVVTFAVPMQELEDKIPECVQLDTFNDQWAFVAIAMVDTKSLRPKGFPKFMGNDFVLTGYRVFVTYHNKAGKRLRGLYILKSETNKKKMEIFGNIFTHYKYSTSDIAFSTKGDSVSVRSESGLDVKVRRSEDPQLPTGSPFSSWKEARRFAGPLPFTITYNQDSKEVLIIEGIRQNWVPEPVSITNSESRFLQSLDLKGAVAANAFVIENIPYYWKKGKIEKWQ